MRIDLNGIWKVRWWDGQRGDRPARLTAANADLSRAWDVNVPGCIHQSLIEMGLLAEPTKGLEILHARWVEETVWQYCRTFRAQRLQHGERAYLVFTGLDLAATIHLNGKEVGRHANSFYPCRIDVTDALVAGENALYVSVESGLWHAADRSAEGMDHHKDGRLTKRIWLRKPQSSHGWDWSPRLLNVGIIGDVYLDIAREVYCDEIAVFSELSADHLRGTIRVRAFAEGLGEKPTQAELTITVAETGQSVKTRVEIAAGANRLETAVEIENPELWWPVGHGGQPRYTITATLSVGRRKIAAATRRCGFRRVVFRQDAHPVSGNYFIVEVNGKPIFCKGGNFVPADIILARIPTQTYETLIELLLEANGNFLRVWGGGLYEAEAFFDLCDEKGVLTWQEFIFACGRYPGTNEAFYDDFKREATYQVRRLAHHPSLIIWCGNNEMEWGGWSMGWDRGGGVVHSDYVLFHQLLPLLMKEEDPTRFYWPSSPYSVDHQFPNRDDTGDQHPWNVGISEPDFRKFRDMICRFCNEGGVLGPAALPTVRACLPKGMDHPGSFAWELHDNSTSYWGGDRPFPDVMLEHWLGRRVESMTVEDYVYWGGVVQGAGLSDFVKNFRRRMFDSAAAVFWMYNDCWPAVRSWTIVDYYLRRTPAFWPVRRAFAPVSVVVSREADRVRFHGVNDGPAWDGELRFGLMALAGRYPHDESISVHLDANASTLLAEIDAAAWDRLGVNTHVAFAILSAAGREAARDCLILPLFREMRWPRAQVDVAWTDGKAVFSSDRFAWRVCLDLDGERPLPDNFFDVYPGVPTVLPWPKRLGAPRILRVGNGIDEAK